MIRSEIIQHLSNSAKQIKEDKSKLEAVISQACAENLWFSSESCNKAVNYWLNQLNNNTLQNFSKAYSITSKPQKVGIIMAGNLPLVGFHDLLVCILSGHDAVVKMSSDDKQLMAYFIEVIRSQSSELSAKIELTDRIPKSLNAVIATGNNNSFRYFEYYFKDIPHLLRKSRKSLAILSGTETEEEMKLLADDIFSYYGLGCRNVSLVFLPKSFDVVKLIDAFEHHNELRNHNRYANNYTYHKALLLMNRDEHLDNGFALIKEVRSLNAPLSCVHYTYYNKIQEVDAFIEENKNDIQCIVGKNLTNQTVEIGCTQEPKLQDFADNIDTFSFLEKL